MKVAVIFNRESQAVINLFGTPSREKYGLETIDMVMGALTVGGHQVKAFEGDKNVITALEKFMPTVISGERPGLVFNLSYGIQGRARYAHIPGILEMLGIPYVGSGPETHTIALDKVLTKIVLLQKGLPTPKFTVIESPDFNLPLADELRFPLIVKPRGEAVSLGLKIVRNNEELREGVKAIYDMYGAPTLVEEYIEGREINVGLLGNNPVQAFPPVEVIFDKGERIYTYEDKILASGRKLEKICPALMEAGLTEKIQSMAVEAFQVLGCFDSARIDFRLDSEENPYILEVNSMPSLEPKGSYVFAAKKTGLGYSELVNRLIRIASQRYFGPFYPESSEAFTSDDPRTKIFTFLTQGRDQLEEELKNWTGLPSCTDDPVGVGAVIKRVESRLMELRLKPVEAFSDYRSVWAWETAAGFEEGTLLVVPVDVPGYGAGAYSMPFRQDSEWLYGEGIASSRAGIASLLKVLKGLHYAERLQCNKVGIFLYADEGRGMRYSSKLLQKAASRVGQVIVLQPGFLNGKVVHQRRGLRKFNILIEGLSQRIGARDTLGNLMKWFVSRADMIDSLNRPEEKVTVALQEVQSERHSVLLPHRIRAMVYVSFLEPELADQAEIRLRMLFAPSQGLQGEPSVYIEKMVERPPLICSPETEKLIDRLEKLSDTWRLPFGLEASLLPSAAGEVPAGIPVICGFGPAGRDIYTPHECIHRGELMQRLVLLALFLLED